MSSEQKYRKYKKLYLELKRQQRGGEDKVIKVVKADTDNDNDKFIVAKKSSDYDQIIKKLKSLNVCEKDWTDINELKYNLKETYRTVGNKILSQFGIYNVFEDKDVNRLITKDDLRRRRDAMCKYIDDKIVPMLEKEKELQDKFIEMLKDVPTGVRKFDIQKYIDFAKEKSMLEHSPEEVIREYSNKIESEAQTNDMVKNFMFVEKDTREFPISKNNHQCVSQCKTNTGIFGFGKSCYCDTVPYQAMTGTYTWDYCNQC